MGTRYNITIDHTKIDADLTDFPITINLAGLEHIWDEITSDADRKKMSAESTSGTKYYCELEGFSTADETGVLHVKIPSVSSSIDTEFVLEIGLDADNSYVGDTGDEAAQNVWDSNFAAIYHMAQDPIVGGACILDSTGNANHGTPNGSMTADDLIDANFGKALSFDGTDDYISTNVFINTSNDFTISGKAKVVDKTTQQGFFGANDQNTNRSYVGLRNSAYWGAVGDTQKYTVSATAISNDTWFNWSLSGSSGTAKYFIDGIQVDTFSYTGQGLQSVDANLIGAVNSVGTPVAFLNGAMCDLRISSTARSTAWIKATNASLTDTLLSVEWDGIIQTQEISFYPTASGPQQISMASQEIQMLTDASGDIFSGVFVPGQSINFTQACQSDLLLSIASPTAALTASASSTPCPGITPQEIEFSTIASGDIFSGVFVVQPEIQITTAGESDLQLSIHAPAAVIIPSTSDQVQVSIGSQIITVSPGMGDVSMFEFTLTHEDTYYLFTLTGSADGTTDIEIPISSFQCRMRSGEPTYLSVVIPGIDYVTQIADRSNGTLKVDMAFKQDGVYLQRETIVQADLETVRSDDGENSKSITLTGHKTETFSGKAVTLDKSIYRSVSGGKVRHRIAKPNIYLRPGDTVTIDADTFTADVVSYAISVDSKTMEMTEA